jgi:Lipopolysaccharide-assembly, LptC-related
LNVAKLKNGIIHLYGNLRAGALSSEKTLAPKPEGEAEKPTVRKLKLEDVFHGEVMPSFGVNRVSSVTMEPIQLILHDEQSVVSETSATYATIRMKERDIFFKGSVRVVSGQARLLTETLSLGPLKGILKSEDQVFVHTATGAKENKGIATDLFLSEVGPSRGLL